MELLSKLKQYYRYRRNWKKFQSRRAKGGIYKNASQQLEFYLQFISKGDLVFDIGANIGEKTEIFLQLGAKVIAVEPQESCWRVLNRRFRDDDVVVEAVALADKEEVRTLFVDRSHTLATISQDWINTVKRSGRFSSHKWAEKMTVQTTTLDVLIEKYGKPVFCKIDVEGAEFKVLQGLSQSISLICIEFVSERLDASMNCIDYLSGLGKAEFNYCLGGSVAFALPDWVDSHHLKSILKEMNSDVENYGDLYAHFVDEQKQMAL